MKLLTMAVIGIMTYGGSQQMIQEPMNQVNPQTEIRPIPEVKDTVSSVDSSHNRRRFLQAVAKLESDNNYGVVSRHGYLGAYQFHPRTIRELGYVTTRKKFLSSPELQDTVMIRYMVANKSELNDIIDKFVGRTIRGIKVTESGIIAAAHFAGTYGIRSWFYPKRYPKGITKDSNGASVTLYMKKFGNYNLEM